MTIIDELLSRLDAVRKSGRGWVARCPAHVDRSPSLGIVEGERGLLIRCFAGCSLNEICEAMGIAVSDLFYNSRSPSPKQSPHTPPQKRSDWRHFSHAMLFVAEGLYVRGQRVLQAAKGLNINTWTDAELSLALDSVSHAMDNMRQSENLEDFVVHYRHNKLQEDANLL